jgi:hypothetical protein
LQCIQQTFQCVDQPVAQWRVGDQWRFDAQHRAMGKGRGDADVLDVQEEADRHVQQ